MEHVYRASFLDASVVTKRLRHQQLQALCAVEVDGGDALPQSAATVTPHDQVRGVLVEHEGPWLGQAALPAAHDDDGACPLTMERRAHDEVLQPVPVEVCGQQAMTEQFPFPTDDDEVGLDPLASDMNFVLLPLGSAAEDEHPARIRRRPYGRGWLGHDDLVLAVAVQISKRDRVSELGVHLVSEDRQVCVRPRPPGHRLASPLTAEDEVAHAGELRATWGAHQEVDVSVTVHVTGRDAAAEVVTGERSVPGDRAIGIPLLRSSTEDDQASDQVGLEVRTIACEARRRGDDLRLAVAVQVLDKERMPQAIRADPSDDLGVLSEAPGQQQDRPGEEDPAYRMVTRETGDACVKPDPEGPDKPHWTATPSTVRPESVTLVSDQ